MLIWWTDRVNAHAGVKTCFCSVCEITEDLEGVSGAALVGVNPVLSCRGRHTDKHGDKHTNCKGPPLLNKRYKILLPSFRSGWLRCRSWQVRAGLSWVPRGKRMVSISCRSELREPKISSMPSLPIRNSVPAASDAGMSGSVSESSWLASMERLDLGLLWMGRGWMTSPGGPWGASLNLHQLRDKH